jgi:ubiquinone/menaquinone biosynthesis C-methylase UbiE
VTKFEEFSYATQADHFSQLSQFPDSLTNSWLDFSSADSWRHQRAFEAAELLVTDLDLSWLTIGDGRLGVDSIRIKSFGFRSVLPTDISSHLLEVSQERGLIDTFRIENAEKLSFQDSDFDLTFCKESLHHFPRPFQALYEMNRVTTKAIVLIEPNDPFQAKVEFPDQFRNLLDRATRPLRRFTKRLAYSGVVTEVVYNAPGYEPSGNFTYAFSPRDIIKFALGLNLEAVAFKGLNDHYIEGCEFEPADAKISKVFEEIQKNINTKDQACLHGKALPDLYMYIIFKDNELFAEKRQSLEATGWTIVKTSGNPYIERPL